MKTALAIALLAFAAPVAAKAPPPPMPAGYDDPGPVPADLLPKIVAGLRRTLKDPYSMRDVTICAPKPMKPYLSVSWVPARWIVGMTLNAKNGFGGYAGATQYIATFENGELVSVRAFEGFAFLSSGMNEKLLAAKQDCPKVPDAEIQALLK